MRGLCLGGMLLWAFSAGAQKEAQERAAVRERLATQKVALQLIESKRVSVLEALELVEQTGRYSADRTRILEEDLRRLRAQLRYATRHEQLTQRLLEQQLERLSPRLRTLYRLNRRHTLAALMSAQDFAGMMWRSRALQATFAADLQLMRASLDALRAQQRAREGLERLRAGVAGRLSGLREQEDMAEGQKLALQDLVALLQSEAAQGRRIVTELEQADAELGRILAELSEGLPQSGFGSLKGKLPLPVPGRIEVGFGRVVNPRFNTVTVQKGVDLRAAQGTEVHAVAEGKVVYAGWLRGYGNLVILDHGSDFHTLHAHLEETQVAVGRTLRAGETLGKVGDTGSLKGAYLYFELRRGGQAQDPAPWFQADAP